MRKIIHRVRQQPERVRRHILHALTAGLGLVLFLLWVYSLGVNLSDSAAGAKVKNDLEPFTVLKDNLAAGFESIIDSE